MPTGIYKRKPKSLEEKFKSYLIRGADNECWKIKGKQNLGRYGRISSGYKSVSAHRFSYEFFKGEIPKGMLVCHTCDNRFCVNPKHLFVGSYKDNRIDAKNKGRMNIGHGEKVGTSKLKEIQVIDILHRLKNKESQNSIARVYSVSRGAIDGISRGINWKYLRLEESKKNISSLLEKEV